MMDIEDFNHVFEDKIEDLGGTEYNNRVVVPGLSEEDVRPGYTDLRAALALQLMVLK